VKSRRMWVWVFRRKVKVKRRGVRMGVGVCVWVSGCMGVG